MPHVALAEESKTGLGFEIGVSKLWRCPNEVPACNSWAIQLYLNDTNRARVIKSDAVLIPTLTFNACWGRRAYAN